MRIGPQPLPAIKRMQRQQEYFRQILERKRTPEVTQ